MKRVFNHPAEPVNPGGKKYWRTFDELAATPDFEKALEKEFPLGASEFQGGELSRRNFIKLMGASTALAGLGLAACRRPELELVPLTRGVEWAIPSKPVFYTTSMPSRRGSQPLVVTTYEGRPTKLEGNPMHPVSHGGTDMFAQAAILSLYDPERSKEFLKRGGSGLEPANEEEFENYLKTLLPTLAADGGAGLAFVVDADNSPTRERLRQEVQKKFPAMRWCVDEPVGNELFRQAAATAFGEGVLPVPVIEKAEVIVSLDADFLGATEGSAENIHAFSNRRRVEKPGDTMNRLYAVENRYTVTGGMADHRLRLPASQIGAFALALAQKLGDANLQKLATTVGTAPNAAMIPDAWVQGLANDLLAAKGRSLVLVGQRQPVAAQLIGFAINQALGNIGTTLVGRAITEQPGVKLSALVPDMDAKKIQCLVIIGANPAFTAPADFAWEKLQAKVPDVIRVSMEVDETSAAARWQVPMAHFLEYWGDGLATDGSYTSIQPMLMPLYGSWAATDLLAVFAGRPKPKSSELVKETFQTFARPAPAAANDAWTKFLHDGFLASSAAATASLYFQQAGASIFIGEQASTPSLAGEDAFEIVLVADPKLDDGRYANHGWLQEVPDPVTQLTWDNAALVSPKTAEKYGLRKHKIGIVEHDVIEIVFEDKRRLEIVALPVPGHAENSITISLGYGRKSSGYLSKGAGVNPYPLRTSAEPYILIGAKVRKMEGKTYPLALAQDESHMIGRALVREATLEQYNADPAFVKKLGSDAEMPGQVSLYTREPLTDVNQWGMAIDLNTCLGCNACVVACQAENNIPIVGKEQVISGRRMQWIRMDRYFASTDGTDDDPEMVVEPMLCQHCESAPCEPVCPVNATVHTEDGLNVMAYNRCIGTRYCANNCPFKVRRFNFFNYNERPIQDGELYKGPVAPFGMAASLKMQKNPNVTVRMRGVMEKCTFCVQRIETARITTKVKAGDSDDVTIPVDSFQVACQQACSAGSIVFGDIKNPESRVSKLKAQQKNYELLAYLNLNTRVTYLARLRNPNPQMPGAEKIGHFEGNVIEK